MGRARKFRTLCSKLKQIQSDLQDELATMKEQRNRISKLSKALSTRLDKFETLNTKRTLSGYNLFMKHWSKKNHGQSREDFVGWIGTKWSNLSHEKKEKWRQKVQ